MGRVQNILSRLTIISIFMDIITAGLNSSTVSPLHGGTLVCVSAALQAGAGADVAHQLAELIRQDLPNGAGAELLLLLHGPCLPTVHFFTNLDDV